MTAKEAKKIVRNWADEEPLEPKTVREVFRALYGREPDEADGGDQEVWSHCWAAIL